MIGVLAPLAVNGFVLLDERLEHPDVLQGDLLAYALVVGAHVVVDVEIPDALIQKGLRRFMSFPVHGWREIPDALIQKGLRPLAVAMAVAQI